MIFVEECCAIPAVQRRIKNDIMICLKENMFAKV